MNDRKTDVDGSGFGTPTDIYNQIQEESIMAEFYIETIAQPNGDHIVHNANCTALPDKQTIRYLGSIASCGGAVKKASEFFKQVKACQQCTVTGIH